jgi:phosphoglycolate phosphatase
MARIVFDLDGTLVDSAPDIRAHASAILAREGAAPLTIDETRRFVGNGAAAFVARMRAARGIPDTEQARLLAAFHAGYDAAVDLTLPYPGVLPALDALAEAGHRLGICTNKPLAPCRALLAHLGLLDRFAVTIGGDSTPVVKPDPAPLRAAFAAMGEGPMLYVGDSEIDAEAAARAEVPFLLFTEGYRRSPPDAIPHDAAFADFAALPARAAGLLARAGAAAEGP